MRKSVIENISNHKRYISEFKRFIYTIYYNYRQMVPKRIIITLRRYLAAYKKKKYRNIWPINFDTSTKPNWFRGWPSNKKFAFILRHDVESIAGYNSIEKLADIDESFGFRSVFNFLLSVYKIDKEKLEFLRNKGFEIGIHGVFHDAKMYLSRRSFSRHAKIINRYAKEFRTFGFASPACFHNLDWLHSLDIEYDSSTFDTDPIEPQNDAASTIFPFNVNNGHHQYIEIPYTLPQDFTLFILLKEKSTDIWKRKIDWIVEKGGMALVNVHTDYLRFPGERNKLLNYPIEYYLQFLDYIKTNFKDQYWHVLPYELARFWRKEFTTI